MKKYLVNYADRAYYESQKNNTNTGLSVGGFDQVFQYGKSDLDGNFCEKNRTILDMHRGAGYWLWKPYVILKALEQIEDGSLLFYSDAGIIFLNAIDPLISVLNNTKYKILLFELEDFRQNYKWTKRDCFVLMNLDREPFIGYPQILASYLMMQKNSFAIHFIKEWLSYAQDYRILTDAANECGLSDYPEFCDHRHDQSILSLLGRKYMIDTIPDISQWGSNRSDLIQILYHHRLRH